ncbi:helix-turn-helix domain-containing protein [Pseudomonas sp. SCB32]|uniref:helix-turn-helix domain-containing protein n=1 Tax=Pseudomonas sp. SCB32 TaxID=2653853 RepID=UPI001264FAD6|nr:helix-turn-helix transcriptional regulator [Pseudomonas sp. SCB32]
MLLADRLKAVRTREKVTQAVLCEEVGLSISTLKKYESNLRIEISLVSLQKIVAHPRYRKYALWLLTGDVSALSEQVSPL